MKLGHWITLAVVLIIGYAIGVKWPNLASNIPGIGGGS
jgi:hypothetical protein